MSLYGYAQSLASKLQETWELSQRLVYRNLADSAPHEDTRRYCRQVLKYMSQGVHDFRRHYNVIERDGNYLIVYTCNVTSMPTIHCVICKRTGDIARFTTQLVNEPHFTYNLIDPRSRESCLSIADYTGDYLR